MENDWLIEGIGMVALHLTRYIGAARLLTAAVVAACLASSAQAAERKFMVSSFDKLIVEGDLNVQLTTGKAPSAVASGEKRAVDTVNIERSGNTVTVRYRPSAVTRSNAGPVTVALTTHNIGTIILRGSAVMTADTVKAPNSRVEIIGAGSLTINDIKSDKLISIVQGSAKFAIAKGAVATGDMLIDGAADIAAPDLIFNELRLIQNGQAKSLLRAERKVEISTAGSGSVEILGKATCFIREAGNAKIRCRNHGQ